MANWFISSSLHLFISCILQIILYHFVSFFYSTIDGVGRWHSSNINRIYRFSSSESASVLADPIIQTSHIIADCQVPFFYLHVSFLFQFFFSSLISSLLRFSFVCVLFLCPFLLKTSFYIVH